MTDEIVFTIRKPGDSLYDLDWNPEVYKTYCVYLSNDYGSCKIGESTSKDDVVKDMEKFIKKAQRTLEELKKL
jgi:hypothetical protein